MLNPTVFRHYWQQLLSVALIVCICVPLKGYAENTVYRFSPVNQYDINLTAAYWNPIINYVSEKSGVKLSLKIV